MVTEGEVIVVGDVEDAAAAGSGPPPEVGYEVLCRQHHRRRLTASRARAVSRIGEPLPFS
jgi:thymidine kinase